MQTQFDHEKLDVYQLELQFIVNMFSADSQFREDEVPYRVREGDESPIE